jgi:flagellar hook assembly protein FlgD
MRLTSYPNPARAGRGTTISFELPATAPVRLQVFDAGGRYVATLVDGLVQAGPVRLPWDGRDHRGRRVASGKYFYRLQAGDETTSRAILVIR